MFPRDFLLQYFLLLCGQMYEGNKDFGRAIQYYKASFKWEQLRILDNRLLKRAFKQLRSLYGNPEEIDKRLQIDNELKKFYVKERTV
jgi:hypothetical protein